MGDQAGEYPGEKPLASEAALGEKPAAPGVIPLPVKAITEDQALGKQQGRGEPNRQPVGEAKGKRAEQRGVLTHTG